MAPAVLCALLAVVSLACGPAAVPAVVPVTGAALLRVHCVAAEDEEGFGFLDVETCAEGDERDVARAIERAANADQRAEEYTDIWAPGALGRVAGRLPERDNCDVALAPETAERWLQRVRAGADLESLELGLASVEGEVRGDTAVVRAVVELRWGMGEDAAGEVHDYQLLRTPTGWRVHEVRIWPTYWAIPDESETYDAPFWLRLDEAAERARLAQEGLEGQALLDAQRRYATALRDAGCVQRAHTVLAPVLADPSAHAEDLRFEAALSRDLGHFDEADAALARSRTAPLGPPRARTLLACWTRESTCPDVGGSETDADVFDDGECMEREVCEVDVLSRVDVPPAPDARALALVRERRDEAEAETLFVLLGEAGEWVHAALVLEGPRHDGGDGVQRVAVAPLERVLLGPAVGEPPPLDGVVVRYELHEREALAGTVTEIVERGIVACVNALYEPRCERFPESVERRAGGGRARVATSSVTFPGDGSVVVRALRGRDPRIVPGRRPIAPPSAP
ncbi:MAG: hypothetical protein R3B40_13060 [Polyangiales bacterium]|nr:hypothetical protein [Myxococcales bacterium]